MSNDNKVKNEIREIILNYIDSFKTSDNHDDLLSDIIGVQIRFKDNEATENIIICEDDIGTSVRRLSEDSYMILEVNPDWADENWWKNNYFISLEEVTLAVAYDYLLQENVVEIREFSDERDAMSYVYDALNALNEKDNFVKRLIMLILDFYPDFRTYS